MIIFGGKKSRSGSIDLVVRANEKQDRHTYTGTQEASGYLSSNKDIKSVVYIDLTP